MAIDKAVNMAVIMSTVSRVHVSNFGGAVAGTGGLAFVVHVISTSSLSMFSLSQGRLSQRRCY